MIDSMALVDAVGAGGTDPSVRSRRVGRGRRPTLVIASTILGVWIVSAVFGGLIEPYSPSAQLPRLKFDSPSWAHLFGTDGFGRDVFSRVIAGARPVLIVAPLSVVVATVLGTVLGLLIGYIGGVADGVVSKILQAVTILPTLFTAILAVSLLGRSTTVLIIVLASFFTPIVTWTVRSATLVEREKQFVEAARLRGEGPLYIVFREILPNITGSIVVESTVRLADAVFAIATLSFIGLGSPPGSPDWGAQVADNRVNLQFAWWTVVFPAVAVASLVISVSLIADVIRERRVQ